MKAVKSPSLIDSDVHMYVPSVDVLLPYLDEHWRAYIRETSFNGPIDTSYLAGAATSMEPKLRGAGLSLATVRERVLEGGNADIAILTCSYAVESVRNPYAAAALASAVNDWQTDEWLAEEPRLRGSVVVASQYPDLAAQEIDRVGGNPGFVQVQLPVRSEALYGNRRYYPIFEAALRHDLAIGIHYGGNPGNPPTAAGWPSFYIEEYTGMAHVFQSQLISLVTEGVFDKYPELRVALVESGVSWLPGMLWRLDKEWKGLRREVPWVRELPSEYVRQHVRMTTWPFDLPADGARAGELVEQIGSDEMLMFASDFPHWHDDAPVDGFFDQLDAGVTQKIKRDNAAAFYRLTG